MQNIPHVLTEENKKNRVEISKQLLEILENGFQNIVTGDETWIYYFTVSSKESNKTWVEVGENRPQITRTAQNSKKRMFCIFFSTDGIVARIVVPKGQTVTGKYYVNHVLPKVFENFKEITKRKTVRHLMLQHDNAAPHKANIVKEYLSENKVKILSHPPYSPDLAPCDFFLFPKIKKELGGRSFSSIENLSRAV